MSRFSKQDFDRGCLVAELLSAAVQGRVPRAISAADIVDLTPLLVRCRSAALAWWGLRSSPFADDEIVAPLYDAYRTETLRAAVANVELEMLFRDISAAALRVIVGKGWSLARLYPSPGLRPYADFDLYCRPRDHDRLLAVLSRRAPRRLFAVDVHRGLSYLDDRDGEAVFTRAIAVPLGSASVTAFGAEDELRLACLHALAEGVIRPIWLCDIALHVAALPPHFDWDYFRAGSLRRSDWCDVAIALAREILGVNVANLTAFTQRPTPRWLRHSVLATWGHGLDSKGSRTPMHRIRRNPKAVVQALVERWPLPIEATLGVGGRISATPRLPIEIAEAARRSLAYLRRRR